jgi:excisionase family DNA binding protein
MPKFYTPEEVAEELRVTRRAVYGWLKTGRLPGYRAGNRWRILPADIQVFLQAHQNAPVARSHRITSSDEEERAARIRAGRGVLAHACVTVDDYLRWKREDVERENQQLESQER